MANHTHAHHHAESHGSLKSYIVGFILSIILTVIPFYMVVNHTLDGGPLVLVLILLAIGQLLIQLFFFLHVSTAPEQRSNLLSFVFTVLIVAILVIGSLWIMWNLNYNMMNH